MIKPEIDMAAYLRKDNEKRVEALTGHIESSLDLINAYWTNLKLHMGEDTPQLFSELSRDTTDKKILKPIYEINRDVDTIKGYLEEISEISSQARSEAYITNKLTEKNITMFSTQDFI